MCAYPVKIVEEVVGQVLEIGTAELAMGEAIQVGLQRSVGQSAHDDRHQQTQRLVFDEFTGPRLAHCEEQASPRDDKD